MKQIKQLASLLLAMVMVLGLSVTAFATTSSTTDSTGTGSITISNPQENVTYTAYKIFDVTYDGSTPENYSYTISTDSPWFVTVAGYADSSYSSSNDKTASYSCNGLTLTQSAADPKIYVVTGSSTAKDSEGNDVTTNLSAADFAEKLKAALTGSSAITDNNAKTLTKQSDNSVKVERLALGYYLVVETTNETGADAPKVALAELTTTDSTATITDKNVWPKFDKQQSDDTGTNKTYTDYALDVQIGDTVYYQITDKVPDITGYKNGLSYTVSDTLTKGLTLNATVDNDGKITTGVTVKIGNDGKTSDWEIKAVYGTYGTDGTPTVSTQKEDNDVVVGFTATVNFVNNIGAETYSKKYNSDLDIVITYEAIVNEKAVSGVETNKATLKFSNDPNKTDSYGDREDKTEVYDASIDVVKFDGKNNTVVSSSTQGAAKLSGAEFVLYRTKTDNTTKEYYVYTPSGSDTTKTYPNVSWTESIASATKLTTGNDGTLELMSTDGNTTILTSFAGLEEGTYYLLETKAPDGYNLLPNAVEINLTNNGLLKVTEADATNNVSGTSDANKLTVQSGNSTATIDITQLAQSKDIANEAGTLLPSTGGSGTTIFYVVGAILVIGAAVLLITRRRMNARK